MIPGGDQAEKNRLEDYLPPAWLIPEAVLDVDIRESSTRITAVLHFQRASGFANENQALRLDGVGLKLRRISLDGRLPGEDEYLYSDGALTIHRPPPSGRLFTIVDINPKENHALEGLFSTGGILCSQNEAEGFRRITYFPDRPDILCMFTITLRADAERYPNLLANGNLVSSGPLPEGLHFATWHDPIPKPCYLVALVAGKFGVIEDVHVSKTGRSISLSIFVPKGEEPRAWHAMESLKRVMMWDEETYGWAYDIDTFMIVGVESFNAGAMENTGLNIFSTSLLLADPETATDDDYLMVERVVAHEYLHHWTGNRISCRDWFQLTLKEGLTVFRDEQYICTRTSPEGFRIDASRRIVENQFPEDDGPFAHPVRPDRYRSIDNFYTQTVYQKGKELIRMLELLVGPVSFRRGLSQFAREHTGRPVVVEDLLSCLSAESQSDLTSFMNWYQQAGVPEVTLCGEYNSEARTYELRMTQCCRSVSDHLCPKPLLFPLSIGLVSTRGMDIPFQIPSNKCDCSSPILRVRNKEEHFVLTEVEEEPVPSLFRDFSAPVRWEFPYSNEELGILMVSDSNDFARWNASQRLSTRILVDLADRIAEGEDAIPSQANLNPFLKLLSQLDDNPGLLRRLLDFPSVKTIVRLTKIFCPQSTAAALRAFRRGLAQSGVSILARHYNCNSGMSYSRKTASIERRSLKNLCLSFLVPLGEEFRVIALKQFRKSDNMTDLLAALAALSNVSDEYQSQVYAEFSLRWKNQPRILDKWFKVRAASREMEEDGALELTAGSHLFDPRRPSALHALYGGFAANLPAFHRSDGSGYRSLADCIISLDTENPHVAARLTKGFDELPLLDASHRHHMESELSRIRCETTPSTQLGEVLSEILSTCEYNTHGPSNK